MSTISHVEGREAERLIELDVIEEKTTRIVAPENLKKITLSAIERSKEGISLENQTLLLDEVDHLEREMEESLLLSQSQMAKQRREYSEANFKSRGNAMFGTVIIKEYHEIATKKQKEWLKSQENFVQTQRNLIVKKEKKIKLLLEQLDLRFETTRIAHIRFKIER